MSRSQLYLSGNAPHELPGALGHGADAIVVDLGDSVPPESKQEARAAVARWLRDLPDKPNVWVCINPGPLGHDDVREILGPRLRGVCLAKAESTIQLDALDAVLSTVENDIGLLPRSVSVVPVLESAAAILAAPAIARAQRVVRLQIGETDLRRELGIEPSADERELLWARSQVVLASAAAGLVAPVAAGCHDIVDLDRFRTTTTALRRMGFGGRACTHTDQIAVVNEVFSG